MEFLDALPLDWRWIAAPASILMLLAPVGFSVAVASVMSAAWRGFTHILGRFARRLLQLMGMGLALVIVASGGRDMVGSVIRAGCDYGRTLYDSDVLMRGPSLPWWAPYLLFTLVARFLLEPAATRSVGWLKHLLPLLRWSPIARRAITG